MMKYDIPSIKITMFSMECVKTTDPTQTMVNASTHTAPTKTLEDKINGAAANAAPVLVFNWE